MNNVTVVTGAGGFLGREVLPRLRREGPTVGVGGRTLRPGLETVDLRDAAASAAFFAATRPAAVAHLAAYPDPDFCEANPDEARRLNVEAVATLRDALDPAARLVYVSSDYVFDGEAPPYREESPRRPVNIYGRTKCEAEDLLAGRPNTVILRIPLLVGGGADLEHSGFISIMRRTAKSPDPQELDDVLVRRPIWTRDVAEVIAFLLSRRLDGVFHASGHQGGTRYSWTMAFAQLRGIPHDHLRPSRTVVTRRAARPRDSHLDDAKLAAAGGPRPHAFDAVVSTVLRELGG